MEDAFMCSSANEWQKYRIQELDNNSLKFPDMAWKVDGEVLYDSRSVYCFSTFFNMLFESETKMTKNVSYDENNIPIFSLDVKLNVFQSLRVFCHTGIVRYTRGETIVKTIDRYSAFHMYDVEGGKVALRSLISQKITPVNAIQAFEYAIGREDFDLLSIINEYIIQYAFLVLRHRNFQSIKRESMRDLILLMKDNSLNIKEMDLLEIIYNMCKKKISEKEFSDFKEPIDLMLFKFDELSMWDCINLESITIVDLIGFLNKYDKFMPNDMVVDTLKIMYNYEHDSSHTSKKRREFRLISSFPRDLNIQGGMGDPQGDVTQLDRDKIQIFYVFDYKNSSKVTYLPSTLFNDFSIRCSIHHLDKSLVFKGHIVKRSITEETHENAIITLKFVNFRHERWKKSIFNKKLDSCSEFEIPNALSYNAIDNGGGYLFDINNYPEFTEGSWLMMSLCIETHP